MLNRVKITRFLNMIFLITITIGLYSNLFSYEIGAGVSLKYGNIVQIRVNRSSDILAMWNASYSTSIDRSIACVIPSTLSLPGVIDTYWIIEGGIPGQDVPQIDSFIAGPMQLKSYVFGTYLSLDDNFICQDSLTYENSTKTYIPASGIYGLSSVTDASMWFLGHGSACIPYGGSIVRSSLDSRNNIGDGSYDPIKLSNGSWTVAREAFKNLYSLELLDFTIGSVPTSITVAPKFIFSSTDLTKAKNIALFECDDFSTAYNSLSGKTVTDRVNIMSPIVDKLKIVYIEDIQIYFRNMKNNFYNDLSSMYSSRNRLDLNELTILAALINSLLTSQLWISTNTTTAQGWLTQILSNSVTTASVDVQIITLQDLANQPATIYSTGTSPSLSDQTMFFNALKYLYDNRNIQSQNQLTNLKSLLNSVLTSIYLGVTDCQTVQAGLTQVTTELNALTTTLSSAINSILTSTTPITSTVPVVDITPLPPILPATTTTKKKKKEKDRNNNREKEN